MCYARSSCLGPACRTPKGGFAPMAVQTAGDYNCITAYHRYCLVLVFRFLFADYQELQLLMLFETKAYLCYLMISHQGLLSPSCHSRPASYCRIFLINHFQLLRTHFGMQIGFSRMLITQGLAGQALCMTCISTTMLHLYSHTAARRFRGT